MKTTEIEIDYKQFSENRKSLVSSLATYLLITLILLGEFFATYEYLYLRTALNSFFLIHLFLSIISLFAVIIFYLIDRDMRLLVVNSLFLSLLGPFSLVIVPLICLMKGIYYQLVLPFSEIIEGIFPVLPRVELSEIVYDRILYRKDSLSDSLPIPYADVFAFGTYQQKRAVIEKILLYYRPEFASFLKNALNDSINSIRVQAATAIVTIDKQCNQAIQNAIKKQSLFPNQLHLTLEIAEKYHIYAEIGLLDEERVEKYTRLAIEYYHKYLEKTKESPIVWLKIGILHYRLGEIDKSYEILNKNIIQGVYTDQTLKIYFSILFELKMFDEMRAIVNEDLYQLQQEHEDLTNLKKLFEYYGEVGIE